MKVLIRVEGNWIRADAFDCARPGNIYHKARGHGGIRQDMEMAIDSVLFNYGVEPSDISCEPAYQWAFDQSIKHFVKAE